MIKYNVSIKATDSAVWQDITHLVRDTITIEEFACNTDFKNSQNVAILELCEDADLYNMLISSEINIFVKILDGDIPLFTGYIPPSIRYTSDGMIQSMSIEVLDYCGLVQKNIDTEFIAENVIVYNGIHDSVCKRLLILAGFDNSVLDPDIRIADTVRAIAISPDDNATYYDVLNQLLYEYGYTLRFNAGGLFAPYQWIRNDITATTVINERNSIGELSATKDAYETSTVKVSWYAVDSRANTSVYVADIPLADNGTIVGYTLKPHMLYPAEANVGTAYLEYTSDAITYNLTKDSAYANAKADLSEIIITKNHRLDWKAKGNNVQLTKANYYNKKAEIVIVNNASVDAMLMGLDIYADVVWRSARRESVANTAIGGGITDIIDTAYISTAECAERLSAALTTYRKYSRYSYKIKSELNMQAGEIVLLDACGIKQICYVVSTAFEAENQPTDATIKTYTLRGVSAPEIDIVSTTSFNGSNMYNKIYQDLANGNVAIGGVPSTILADITPPDGGNILSATPLINGNVRVEWSVYYDNIGGSGLSGYSVYRRNGAISQRIGGTAKDSLTYIDGTTVANTEYYYGVSAYDRNNNESPISWLSTPVTAKNIEPIAPPHGLVARATKGAASLTWLAPAEASEITYYEIWKKSPVGDWYTVDTSGTTSYNEQIGKIEKTELIGWRYKVRAYNLHETYSAFDTVNGTSITDYTQYGSYIKTTLTPVLKSSINTVTVSWAKQYELMDYKAVNIEYKKSNNIVIALQSAEFYTITALAFDKDAQGKPIDTIYYVRLQQVATDNTVSAWSAWVAITIKPADYTVLRADMLEATETNFTHIQAGWVIGDPQDSGMPADEKFKLPNGTVVNNTSYIDFRTGRFRLGDKNAYMYGNFTQNPADSFMRFKSVQLNLSSADLVTNANNIYLKHGGNALTWGNSTFATTYASIISDGGTLSLNATNTKISGSLGIGVQPDSAYSLKTAGKAYFGGDILMGGNALTWVNSTFATTYASIVSDEGTLSLNATNTKINGSLGVGVQPDSVYPLKTAGKAYFGGDILMGGSRGIYARHLDGSNNEMDGEMYLNYINMKNVHICSRGGNVGIGANANNGYRLYVAGEGHFTQGVNYAKMATTLTTEQLAEIRTSYTWTNPRGRTGVHLLILAAGGGGGGSGASNTTGWAGAGGAGSVGAVSTLYLNQVTFIRFTIGAGGWGGAGGVRTVNSATAGGGGGAGGQTAINVNDGYTIYVQGAGGGGGGNGLSNSSPVIGGYGASSGGSVGGSPGNPATNASTPPLTGIFVNGGAGGNKVQNSNGIAGANGGQAVIWIYG